MLLEAVLKHPEKGPNYLFHSVREDFGDLLRYALKGEAAFAALGPVYKDDPAESALLPFRRSALESGWDWTSERDMVHDEMLERIKSVRTQAAGDAMMQGCSPVEIDHWTRAGLVLEIARRRGVHLTGRGVAHVEWKMNATVTGRFGAETVRGQGWSFNPLNMGPDDRARLRPSDYLRHVAVLDFKAMDVCSMSSVVPGLAELLGDHPDPYQKVADVTGLRRETAKLTFLSWAYGAVVDPDVLDQLWYHFRPVHDFTVGLPHGDFPRMVQSVSAAAFRAALSAALPLLTGEHFIPMIAVHDELALDCSEVGLDRIKEVTMAMEAGASARIGRPYRVGVRTGYTYAEAKGG